MSAKGALAHYLSANDIRLVHVWRNGKAYNAMMEWPVRKPERHITGAADTDVAAVLRALDLIGFGGLRARLTMLERLL